MINMLSRNYLWGAEKEPLSKFLELSRHKPSKDTISKVYIPQKVSEN